MIENLWVCSGGTTTTVDTCTLCINGESPDPTKTFCAVQCGDGLREPAFERCDDGNVANGDGCDSTCLLEANSV